MVELSSAGNTANSQIEAALLPHRIDAVKSAWTAVLNWNQVSAATVLAGLVSDDWIEKFASDPGAKQTFDVLLNDSNHLEFIKAQGEVERVRPFLSEPCWAIYYAHYSFMLARFTKAKLLSLPEVVPVDAIRGINERELIAQSAPEAILSAYDENNYLGTEKYLSYLKEKLVDEFRESLSSSRAGEQALFDAEKILAAAERLAAQSSAQASKAAQVSEADA